VSDPDLLSTIKALIADLCAIDVASIHDDGKLIGYGLDSVRALDLLLAIEDEVGVELSEHHPELAQVHTVAELAAFVARRRARRG
jgi:acyl carrier protein